MQESVTNSNEKETLFSAFLNVMEAQEKKAQAERQLQEEKYLRRRQRIYEFHERQRRDVTELRRCMDLVSQHAHTLESALRTAGGAGGGVALGGVLAKQAVTLQRCMMQCVRDAARIRDHLAANRRDHMDAVLAKMKGELARWTAFVQRTEDAACSSEMLFDNLHNLIAEQRRCIRDVSASGVLSPAPPLPAPVSPPQSPAPSRTPVTIACSTPIAND